MATERLRLEGLQEIADAITSKDVTQQRIKDIKDYADQRQAEFISTGDSKLSEIETQGEAYIEEIKVVGTGQIKDVGDKGTEQINAVIAEGTAQKNAIIELTNGQKTTITAEGEKQLSAIQEVADTIPDDYMSLEETVNQIVEFTDAGEVELPTIDWARKIEETVTSSDVLKERIKEIKEYTDGQIGTINTEVKKQIDTINAVKDSIPADYSSLSESIVNINNIIGKRVISPVTTENEKIKPKIFFEEQELLNDYLTVDIITSGSFKYHIALLDENGNRYATWFDTNLSGDSSHTIDVKKIKHDFGEGFSGIAVYCFNVVKNSTAMFVIYNEAGTLYGDIKELSNTVAKNELDYTENITELRIENDAIKTDLETNGVSVKKTYEQTSNTIPLDFIPMRLKKGVSYDVTYKLDAVESFNSLQIHLATRNGDKWTRHTVISVGDYTTAPLQKTLKLTPSVDVDAISFYIEYPNNFAQTVNVSFNVVRIDNFDAVAMKVREHGLELEEHKKQISKNTSDIEKNAENIKECMKDIPNDSVNMQKLSPEIRKMLETSGGTITNNPDGEWLTTNEFNQLTLKDKEHDNSTSGLGRYYVKRIIDSNGRNVLTSDMLHEDSINVVQYAYDNVDADVVVVPHNAVLLFLGGSIKNATMTGDDTLIIADRYCIFDDVILNGTFKTDKWKIEWFAKTHDYSIAISEAVKTLHKLSYDNHFYVNNNTRRYTPSVDFGSGQYHCYTPINLVQKNGENVEPLFLSFTGVSRMSSVIISHVNNTELNAANASVDNVAYLFDYSPEVPTLIEVDWQNIGFRGYDVPNNAYSYDGMFNGALKIGGRGWTNSMYIDNCYFYGFYCMINVSNANYWSRLCNNLFQRSVYAVVLKDINSTAFTNNEFRLTLNTGLTLIGGGGCSITGNDFSEHNVCLRILNGASGINISGNYFEAHMLDDAVQEREIVIGDEANMNVSFNDILIKGNLGTTNPTLNKTTKGTYEPGGVYVYGNLVNCDVDAFIFYYGTGGHGNIGRVSFTNDMDVSTLASHFIQMYDAKNKVLYINGKAVS